MTALILKSQAALLAPLPGTPKLPDIDSALYIDMDAAALAVADAASVTIIVAAGSAPLVTRTYSNNQGGSGVEFPKMDIDGGPDGGKALVFNGNARISNMSLGGDPILPAVAQPHTDIVVAYLNNEAQGANARFVGGTISGGNYRHNIFPSSGESLIVTAGNNVVLANVLPLAKWFIFGVVFNGASSKVLLPNGTVTAISDIGAEPYAGNNYGMSTVQPPSGGLKGRIRRHRMYTRALSDADLLGAFAYFKQLYGITP